MAAAVQPNARNVVVFICDGMGVTGLNAAGIYAYGRPQALFVQSMPYLALSDTSTAGDWVGDGAAGVSAIATGAKGQRGVISESAEAVKGRIDGRPLKTVLEYAEERGLATGVISNEATAGVSDGTVASFYAHGNDRALYGATFLQILSPRFGDGLDVAIGSGQKHILEDARKLNRDVPGELRAKGYAYFESLDELARAPVRPPRAVVLTDDDQFDIGVAVDQAIAILSRNPKGFFLAVHSNCFGVKGPQILDRAVALDRVVKSVVESHGGDTLVLFTADHSTAVQLRGDDPKLYAKGGDVWRTIKIEDIHTGEEVPLLAVGPGAQQVHGYISNTQIFDIILNAYGWSEDPSR
jgi:alkaline phosphatase